VSADEGGPRGTGSVAGDGVGGNHGMGLLQQRGIGHSRDDGGAPAH
jgi:hypothetical protein